MKVLAIFTCFNRKDKTESCIKSLVSGNLDCEFTFIVADDSSTDGTRELLKEMKKEYDINILEGTGSLYYSGGMYLGMRYALEKLDKNYDYMLMMNDDVEFYNGCIEKMERQSREQGGAVVIGAMQNSKGNLSYGAVKYIKGIKYKIVDVDQWKVPADTFNANCVLIPYEVFVKVGAIDSYYIHSLGDFDYGLMLKKLGYRLFVSKEYVGLCNNNSNKGTWTDCSLGIKERIKKKENIKGAPTKQWFYFLRKNFGIIIAIKSSCTPYIRIFLGK